MDLSWNIPEKTFFIFKLIEVDISKSMSISFRKVLTKLNSKLESILITDFYGSRPNGYVFLECRKFFSEKLVTFLIPRNSAINEVGANSSPNTLRKKSFLGFLGYFSTFSRWKKFLEARLITRATSKCVFLHRVS